MCSTSKVTDALKSMNIGSNDVLIPSIAANKIRHNRSAYYLVDVREPCEVAGTPFPDADLHMPVGLIFPKNAELVTKAEGKTIVCCCKTSKRSQIAAQAILEMNPTVSVKVLQNGFLGWENASAVSPDFVVVLGLGGDAYTEKLSLALAAAGTAVDMHESVALVLLSDGVNWFVKADSPKSVCKNVESVSHGAPFKPCKAMLNKFVSSGGIILCCTTCYKHRGYTMEDDMMDCVNELNMPDLIRMLGEAKGGNLQFM